jgi:hypothetical protein
VLLLLLLQTQGNNKLRIGLKSKNRLLLREAVEFYDKGLGLKCSDVQVTHATAAAAAAQYGKLLNTHHAAQKLLNTYHAAAAATAAVRPAAELPPCSSRCSCSKTGCCAHLQLAAPVCVHLWLACLHGCVA